MCITQRHIMILLSFEVAQASFVQKLGVGCSANNTENTSNQNISSWEKLTHVKPN